MRWDEALAGTSHSSLLNWDGLNLLGKDALSVRVQGCRGHSQAPVWGKAMDKL